MLGLLTRLVPAPWLVVGVVLALAASHGAAYVRGWQDRAARCDAAEQRARAEALEVRVADVREALEQSQRLARAQEAENQELSEEQADDQERIRGLQEDLGVLRAAADTRCEWTDAERVRICERFPEQCP